MRATILPKACGGGLTSEKADLRARGGRFLVLSRWKRALRTRGAKANDRSQRGLPRGEGGAKSECGELTDERSRCEVVMFVM
jgi:hypothetical protein